MPGLLPGRGRNSTVEKLLHQLRPESGSCMGDESSPPSRCTSPDLQGYTTAGEEVVAGESGSNSSVNSNPTVRDFSTPQLRPRAKTVPRFIWKRPPGYVKPRRQGNRERMPGNRAGAEKTEAGNKDRRQGNRNRGVK